MKGDIMIIVVPNELSNTLNAKLDDAFKTCPVAEKERGILYDWVLEYYDAHGLIPEFSLTPEGTP